MTLPEITDVAIDDPRTRAELLAFLAPFETQALFLIGNLKRSMPGSHLYAVRDGGRLLAVAGYYDGGRSFVPFAVEPDLPAGAAALAALALHVAERHQPFEWVVGPAAMARPGLAALEARGWRVLNDPRQVFMEHEGLPPPTLHRAQVRGLTISDHDEVLHLLRWLHAGQDDGRPIEADERRDIEINPERLVLDIGGRIAATAATNGLGIRAFQILGVVTHPALRGRGYGGAVVAALMDRLVRQGARRSVLFTGHDNAPAIRCYERLGFRTTGDFLLAHMASP
ncbi:MAG: GNAT family N-acetyltransferase [Planctomycetota bacterium]